jgi:hypothetical protein
MKKRQKLLIASKRVWYKHSHCLFKMAYRWLRLTADAAANVPRTGIAARHTAWPRA